MNGPPVRIGLTLDSDGIPDGDGYIDLVDPKPNYDSSVPEVEFVETASDEIVIDAMVGSYVETVEVTAIYRDGSVEFSTDVTEQLFDRNTATPESSRRVDGRVRYSIPVDDQFGWLNQEPLVYQVNVTDVNGNTVSHLVVPNIGDGTSDLVGTGVYLARSDSSGTVASPARVERLVPGVVSDTDLGSDALESLPEPMLAGLVAHLYSPADSDLVYRELRTPRSPEAQGRLSTATIREGRFELLPPGGDVEARTTIDGSEVELVEGVLYEHRDGFKRGFGLKYMTAVSDLDRGEVIQRFENVEEVVPKPPGEGQQPVPPKTDPWKVIVAIIVAAVVIGIALLALLEEEEPDPEAMRIHHIDVGQGDSTLIVTPEGETVLIDSGDDSQSGSVVIDYLEDKGITRIDHLVLTHPHADHVGGHAEVIKHFETNLEGIGAVYDNGIVTDTEPYTNYREAVDKYGVERFIVEEGDKLPLKDEDTEITVLNPASGDSNKGLHYTSVALLVEYQEFRYLTTGDANSPAEQRMVSEWGPRLNAVVYQAGHHGSNTSSTPQFLDSVNPKYSIISSAYDNHFDHPNDDVLRELANRSIETYWTGVHNDTIVVFEGEVTEIVPSRQFSTDPEDLIEEKPDSNNVTRRITTTETIVSWP